MDLKTYQMLSLLSKVVSNMPQNDEGSQTAKANTLLHKCLAQFTGQQQIHAQQSGCYICGYGDSMSSHPTRPMRSSLLISHVKNLYSPNKIIDEADNEDEDIEPVSLQIILDHKGNLLTTNQFHDYYYRAPTLHNMNFFKFSQCIKLEKKINSPKNTIDTHTGVLARHALLPPHQLAESHCLVEHWNEERGDGEIEYVPRVTGCSIPRPSAGIAYTIFALAHFKPFSVSNPLIEKGDNFLDAFKKYKFSNSALITLKNWDATNECEDARDADRLNKRPN
jgi:hypothetical protein